LFLVAKDQGRRQAQPLGRAADASHEHPAPDPGHVNLKSIHELLQHKTAPALDPEARLGQALVVLKKLPVRNAISIQEDEVFTRGFRDSPVQQDRLSKSVMRMPYVKDREFGLPPPLIDQSARLFPRPVIGNEDLIRGPAL